MVTKKDRDPIPRRGFLAKLGATGLGVAAATFGRDSVAFAANAGCCTLRWPPGGLHYVTWTKCSQSDYLVYSWTCPGPAPGPCRCCEMSQPGAPNYPGYTNSAYICP